MEISPRNNFVTKEEEEELRRALAASVKSMKSETSGSTSREDLVPFLNSSPWSAYVNKEEEEELAVSVESMKFETRGASSSKAKID